MGSTKRERGVLKLVHPGRYVEVHREPIRAEEIMRKNPRHCVTRPDVFEFPWIVVKPESVLHPGSVFLIVPYSKIYALLKAKGLNNHPPFSQYPYNHFHQQLKHDHSPVTCYAGMSSILHRHKKHIKALFVRRGRENEVEGELQSCNKHSLSPFSKTIMSPDIENVHKYDWDIEMSQSQSYDYEDTPERIEQELLEEPSIESTPYEDTRQNRIELPESSFETIPYEAKQYYLNNKKSIGTETHEKDVNLEFSSSEQVTIAKSCLRRPDSLRNSLNLKVSFNIPINKEEH